MNTNKIDVLVVMDRADAHYAGWNISAADKAVLDDLNDARAAVAELIEAGKAAMVLCAEACGHANPAMRQDAILRRDALAAALSRVGGV